MVPERQLEPKLRRREAPRTGEAQGAARRCLSYPRGCCDGHGARRQSARPRPGFQTGGAGSSSARAASPAGTLHRLPGCRRHLRRLVRRSPPLVLGSQARAAHLNARGCGSRGSGGERLRHRPGRTQVERRGFVESSVGYCRRPVAAWSRGPRPHPVRSRRQPAP